MANSTRLPLASPVDELIQWRASRDPDSTSFVLTKSVKVVRSPCSNAKAAFAWNTKELNLKKANHSEILTWGSEVHETLVILMHSFNSLLWNLAPASLIMVRLEPHLQRRQQRQSSVGCTHWLSGPVCGQCTQHRRLYTEFQKDLDSLFTVFCRAFHCLRPQ